MHLPPRKHKKNSACLAMAQAAFLAEEQCRTVPVMPLFL